MTAMLKEATGELDSLLTQRDNLLAKIQAIAEKCEGIENESNAAKVTELNRRQAELLSQSDALKGKLAVIDSELSSINANIRELSGSGVDKILEAIKNQRWYFFKNKPKVLMDRDTALLWADLNYFPYRKNNLSNDYNVTDARNVIDETNSKNFADFSNWRIPTPYELWKMIEDKSFPFQEGSYWRIKGYQWGCVDHSDGLHYKNLDKMGATSDMGSVNQGVTQIFPCCSAFVPEEYEANISPSNNFYTEKEKLQFTLDIFVKNDLIPLFTDESVAQLYRKIYVDKPALLKQLAEIETKITALQGNQFKLTANFNYKPLLAKYDVTAVDNSVIQYYEAVLSVTDIILDILQEYEAAQVETISECARLTLKLSAKYTDSPHLTDVENELLKQRQQFFATHLELGMDDVKAQILSLRVQAVDLENRLDAITHGANAIRELSELEAESRVSFAFLVENIARIVTAAQRKVDFFSQHRVFVSNIVNSCAAWNEDYKAFKTNMREELASICRDAGIDEDIYSNWYNDWQSKRLIIEQRFLPLIEFALKGNLLSDDNPAAERVLEILQTYKDAVDHFYLNERKNIYLKFAFQAGGDLQEKFETESELYKCAEKLQRELTEVIFSRDKTEERMFLLRWAEPLLNVPIDEIVAFVEDRQLSTISTEIMEQFVALRKQNFAAYLADSQAYSEAVQKREKEYNALVFRMRKDLIKQ